VWCGAKEELRAVVSALSLSVKERKAGALSVPGEITLQAGMIYRLPFTCQVA
jgi:hypothetical protein